MKSLAGGFAAILLSTTAYTQSLPVGSPVVEEALRRAQISGTGDTVTSFLLRPLVPASFDSVYPTGAARRPSRLRILPVQFRQQFNSHHPFGWNDGSMIPSNGYQAQLSAGVYTRIGPLSIQLQPEVVWAQNASYTTFPARYNDTLWQAYYNTVLNRIDAPERFGTRPYARVFGGQSSVRLNVKMLSVGISTENLWWGPGIRNSLLMSNNAPGFPHLTLNTTAPLRTPIGWFEGQMVVGWLQRSGIFPSDTNRIVNGRRLYDPKREENRYLNGAVLVWQPKWTPGLFLGFSRVFYLYTGDRERSLNGYLPVIGQLFKGNLDQATGEDRRRRDQMLALFFRLVLPKEKAEVYAEYGRNDHSGNARDLLLQPEHSRAYTVGLRKLFDRPKKPGQVELMAEMTNLQLPATQLLREQESWYGHYQVRHGYTQRGQVIGAGIGPGGNSQTLGVSLVNGLQKTGLMLERVVYNNDFYYAAFTPTRNYTRHWVDVCVQLNRSWQHKRFLWEARLTWVRSVNFQWQEVANVQNWQPALNVSYVF